MITLKEIEKHKPCPEALDWVKPLVPRGGIEWEDLLTRFTRADWMLWAVIRSGLYTRQQVVRLTCICAMTSLRYVGRGERRPAWAIREALRWTEGKATIEQVREAGEAAYASSAAAYAAHAATYAAYAAHAASAAAYAAYVAHAASAAAYAAHVAAYTADATSYAAYVAAYAAATTADTSEAHARMCNLMRREMATAKFKGLGR